MDKAALAAVCATGPGARGRRGIGPVGTIARVCVGIVLVGIVAIGHFQPVSWVLGLLVFPVVLLAWQWWRARHNPTPLRATGPVASIVNIAVFLALLLMPWYLPPVAFLSNAAQLFYGGAMLLAAARGYAGCEVLAVSNWVLRRDDQIGCVFFGPIDYVERRRR